MIRIWDGFVGSWKQLNQSFQAGAAVVEMVLDVLVPGCGLEPLGFKLLLLFLLAHPGLCGKG
jgi:hypothetical protein